VIAILLVAFPAPAMAESGVTGVGLNWFTVTTGTADAGKEVASDDRATSGIDDNAEMVGGLTLAVASAAVNAGLYYGVLRGNPERLDPGVTALMSGISTLGWTGFILATGAFLHGDQKSRDCYAGICGLETATDPIVVYLYLQALNAIEDALERLEESKRLSETEKERVEDLKNAIKQAEANVPGNVCLIMFLWFLSASLESFAKPLGLLMRAANSMTMLVSTLSSVMMCDAVKAYMSRELEESSGVEEIEEAVTKAHSALSSVYGAMLVRGVCAVLETALAIGQIVAPDMVSGLLAPGRELRKAVAALGRSVMNLLHISPPGEGARAEPAGGSGTGTSGASLDAHRYLLQHPLQVTL
jgi:archaellum component FlaC